MNWVALDQREEGKVLHLTNQSLYSKLQRLKGCKELRIEEESAEKLEGALWNWWLGNEWSLPGQGKGRFGEYGVGR